MKFMRSDLFVSDCSIIAKINVLMYFLNSFLLREIDLNWKWTEFRAGVYNSLYSQTESYW